MTSTSLNQGNRRGVWQPVVTLVLSIGSMGMLGCTAASYNKNNGAGPPVAPYLLTQPASQSVTAGQSATFTVTASGTAPLSYQWKKNGTGISGATSASYTTPTTRTSDNGSQFTVQVSNAVGNVTSSPAMLTVNSGTAPPTVPTRLTATAVSSAQINLSWTASSDSGGTLAGYKIYRGGTKAATSTTTSFQDTGLAASTTYSYTVAAFDTAGNTSAQSTGASATTQALSGGGGGGLPNSLGWYQIPGTTTRALCPPYSEIQGATGCPAVMSAWSGGLFDTTRNRLIIFGGGHSDYFGNELYAINLSANPITETLVKDSTHNPNMNGVPPGCPDAYGDGNPVSRHTYGSLVYIPSADRYLAYSGARSSCGFFTTASWDFDPNANTWARTGDGPGTSGSQPVAAYDSVTNTVYAVDNNVVALWNYSPATRTWTNLTGISTVCQTTTPSATIDPGRRFMFCVGGGVLSKISLAAPYAASNLTGSGCATWMGASAPGIAYDPVQKLLVGWAGGNAVYLYNPDTDSCSTVTSYTGGPTTIQPNGTYGRFQYSPSSGVFVVVNDIDSNAYALRLTPAAGGGSTGPAISAVSVLGITANAATIAWTTDVAATSQVDYGTSAAYGSTTTLSSPLVTSHSVALSALSAGTTYHFRVRSANSGGTASTSGDFTFATSSGAPAPVAVTINPIAATVLVSATQQFTATVTGSTNTGVTWTATGGTVAAGGLYTAPATAGSFTVTATSMADTTKSASAAITVTTQSSGAINGWSSRIAGVNTAGGAASLVSSYTFESFSDTCSGSGCNTYAPNKQVYIDGSYVSGSPIQDCTVTTDSFCSVHMTVPVGSSNTGNAGHIDYNFGVPSNRVLFGQGQEFFIQYKGQYDANLLGALNGSAPGIHQDITTEGDSATTFASECSQSPSEFVTQVTGPNSTGSAFVGPIGYTDCGNYTPIQLPGIASSNFLDQDAAGCVHYSGRGIAITDPTCWLYTPGEWFAVQKHIKVGTWGSNNSLVEIWYSHAGQPSRLLVNATDWMLRDVAPDVTDKYGKIVLGAYSQDTPLSNTSPGNAWFNEIIVSTRRIPDPDVATPNAPDSLSQSNISASSVTINWRVNSHNGTAQDDTGFLIERCTGAATTCFPNPQSGFTQIGTTAPGASSYVDNTVVSGTTYTYRVRATNPSGNSAYAAAFCFNGSTSCGGTVVVP